jgi:hypothetical protein
MLVLVVVQALCISRMAAAIATVQLDINLVLNRVVEFMPGRRA